MLVLRFYWIKQKHGNWITLLGTCLIQFSIIYIEPFTIKFASRCFIEAETQIRNPQRSTAACGNFLLTRRNLE